jgi:hypothetical protein
LADEHGSGEVPAGRVILDLIIRHQPRERTMSKPGGANAVGRSALVGIGLAVLIAVAGCAASGGSGAPAGSAGQPGVTGSSQPASPVRADPAPCVTFGCQPGPAQQLTGGYSVRLWLSKPPSDGQFAADRSTPVLELGRDGQHVSWWVGRLGFGWSASVRCLATAAEPHCVVLAAAGAHAGSAEVVFLRDGALIGPAQASVVFDSGAPTAADLDHDGLLDVLGVENDYQPDYAQGHNYFTSYRLAGDALHQTGCLLKATADQPRPATLLTGACPNVQPG